MPQTQLKVVPPPQSYRVPKPYYPEPESEVEEYEAPRRKNALLRYWPWLLSPAAILVSMWLSDGLTIESLKILGSILSALFAVGWLFWCIGKAVVNHYHGSYSPSGYSDDHPAHNYHETEPYGSARLSNARELHNALNAKSQPPSWIFDE